MAAGLTGHLAVPEEQADLVVAVLVVDKGQTELPVLRIRVVEAEAQVVLRPCRREVLAVLEAQAL